MGFNVDEIASPQAAAFKFENVGDMVKGLVVWHGVQNGLSFDESRTESSLKVVLEQDDGEELSVYCILDRDVNDDVGDGSMKGKRDSKAIALAAAIRAAGESSLENGGVLAMRFSEEYDTGKKGHNKAKRFQAEYKAPVGGPAVTDADAADGAVTGLI